MCPHGNRKARLQAIHRKVPVSALLFGIRMAKVPWEIYETISPLPLIPNRVLSSMPPRLRPDSPAWRDEEIAPRTNSWAEISDGCYASNKARVPRRTDTTLVVAHNEVYNTAITTRWQKGLGTSLLGPSLRRRLPEHFGNCFDMSRGSVQPRFSLHQAISEPS